MRRSKQKPYWLLKDEAYNPQPWKYKIVPVRNRMSYHSTKFCRRRGKFYYGNYRRRDNFIKLLKTIKLS